MTARGRWWQHGGQPEHTASVNVQMWGAGGRDDRTGASEKNKGRELADDFSLLLRGDEFLLGGKAGDEARGGCSWPFKPDLLAART